MLLNKGYTNTIFECDYMGELIKLKKMFLQD